MKHQPQSRPPHAELAHSGFQQGVYVAPLLCVCDIRQARDAAVYHQIVAAKLPGRLYDEQVDFILDNGIKMAHGQVRGRAAR